MSRRSKQGKRWSITDKTLALSIFYHSRKAYRLLSKLFCLPSKSTLLRTLRKSNLSPGDKVFDALRLKVASMPDIDCQCAVTFDEIDCQCAVTFDEIDCQCAVTFDDIDCQCAVTFDDISLKSALAQFATRCH